MAITTPEQAKETVQGWLTENHHQINEIADDNSNFHFEIDYPLGSMKRQRIIQPKEYPGLMVIPATRRRCTPSARSCFPPMPGGPCPTSRS